MKQKNQISKLFIALGLYLASMVIGVWGYHSIEQYSFVDSVYMTMLAISTVGFGEVKTLTTEGKIFTSVYILFNLCILAYIVSVISRYLFEGELKQIFNNYMSDRELKKMEGHVIVCGYGRNGQRACEELAKEGYQFVIIDPNEENILSRSEGKPVNYIIGDATDEANLINANITKAYALITAVPRDSINVFVTLTARELNKDLYIIARATLDSTISKLRTAGANKVVLPDAIGGRYMADLVSKPQIIDFLDLISGADGELKLVEINIGNFRPEYKNKSIVEMQPRANSGVNILGYKAPKSTFIFNPPADISLGEEGILMVLGKLHEIKLFKQKYTLEQE